MRVLIRVLVALNLLVFGYIGYRKLTDGPSSSSTAAAASDTAAPDPAAGADQPGAGPSPDAQAGPTPDPSWPVITEGRFTFQVPGNPSRSEVMIEMKDAVGGIYYQWIVDATPGAEVIVIAGTHAIALTSAPGYQSDLDTSRKVVGLATGCLPQQSSNVPSSVGHAVTVGCDVAGTPVNGFIVAHVGIGLAIVSYGDRVSPLVDRIAASVTIDGQLVLGENRNIPGLIVAGEYPTP